MSTLDAWREITQSEAVVGFFRGLFERAGVRVLDRNEAFTCIHRGDRVEFEPTLDVSTVDFTVDVTSDQVDRLAEHARSGAFDAVEQFRIVSTLLTPATDGTLRNPILSNGLVRRLARIEDLIHVRLLAPSDQERDTTHTLIHAAGQWLVIPGLHGRPRRTFRLTVDDALTYHRRVFAALREDSWLGWLRFMAWYLRWRPAVSGRGTGEPRPARRARSLRRA